MIFFIILFLQGYENANHFMTHFKKITGITPSEYRTRMYNGTGQAGRSVCHGL